MSVPEMEEAYFRVSPAVLRPLGAEQLQDPVLALLELVKNSWDADAETVEVSVTTRSAKPTITVTDDGGGMTATDFRDRWLVIGSSSKRKEKTSVCGRPLIGEKGLGRLATFALGNVVEISSATSATDGFSASVDWRALLKARALDDYKIRIGQRNRPVGTAITIRDLFGKWTDDQTRFFVTHAQFLASVPGQSFKIRFRVDGRSHTVQDPLRALDRLGEARLEMVVGPRGEPRITSCTIGDTDKSNIVFRSLAETSRDARLDGMRLHLTFFKRDEAAKRLAGVLERNEVRDALERYQGIRIFRDGINVPPYGLDRDDWAGLEKQRTATGGPTMVPGNSQLVGELHVTRDRQSHLVITAGRSGFSDRSALNSMATYVRWAVRELGTARRAAALGVSRGDVPTRVDEERRETAPDPLLQATDAVKRLKAPESQKSPSVMRSAVAVIEQAVSATRDTLRLYAQLASVGIAATSFAHELRTEFDIISESLQQLRASRKFEPDLLRDLNTSWKRVQTFAGLFRVLPVKVRRRVKVLAPEDIVAGLRTVLSLVPPDRITGDVTAPKRSLKVVPADFDSIVLNLVSNASKAIAASKRRNEGRIQIRVTTTERDAEVAVADNGCGVSSQVARIMFDPLEGKFEEGTGMGLPIVQYLAHQYGGDVRLGSTPPAEYVTEMVVSLKGVVA